MKKIWKCEVCGSYQKKNQRVVRRFCSDACANQGDAKYWSTDELVILRDNYPVAPFPELYKLLHKRSGSAIRAKAHLFGLSRDGDRRWTKKEDEILRRIYSNSEIDEICSLLPNRTWISIKLKAISFGLKLGRGNNKKSDLRVFLDDTPETYYWLGFLMADGHFEKKGRLIVV